MNRLKRSFLTIFFAGLLLPVVFALAVGAVRAQAGDSWQYFPDTGHTVAGEFWQYYRNNRAVAAMAGSPITEQFVDAQSGRIVQYFQRARFEYFPEYAEGMQVQLTSLGALVLQQYPPQGAMNSTNPLGCRSYAETGVWLCYAFLEYYDHNGGGAVFGRPLTSFVFYNNRIVQYFERARFEWYPEYPEGQKVVLAQLGRMYFDMTSGEPNLLLPVRAENAPSDIRSIRAQAFTFKSLTHASDEQILFVVVQDQTLSPVSGASVVMEIRWPDGTKERIARTTDGSGVVVYPFAVRGQAHGRMVLVGAEVEYMGMNSRAQTSFRIWK